MRVLAVGVESRIEAAGTNGVRLLLHVRKITASPSSQPLSFSALYSSLQTSLILPSDIQLVFCKLGILRL